MRPLQATGLVLWRGGVLFVTGWIGFQVARRFLRLVELPFQLEIAGALMLAGAALVMLSLILERVQDARVEGDLKE